MPAMMIGRAEICLVHGPTGELQQKLVINMCQRMPLPLKPELAPFLHV